MFVDIGDSICSIRQHVAEARKQNMYADWLRDMKLQPCEASVHRFERRFVI